MDAEPISGIVCLAQPTLEPLGDTRSVVESFARWSGRQESAYDIFCARPGNGRSFLARNTPPLRRSGIGRYTTVLSSWRPGRLPPPRFTSQTVNLLAGAPRRTKRTC